MTFEVLPVNPPEWDKDELRELDKSGGGEVSRVQQFKKELGELCKKYNCSIELLDSDYYGGSTEMVAYLEGVYRDGEQIHAYEECALGDVIDKDLKEPNK